MELQNRIIGVAGREGSGKSTAARRILQSCSRLFVFDCMADHSWVPNSFRNIDDVDEFLAWASMQTGFAGRLIPQSDLAEDFAELSGIVNEQGNMLYAVEEVPMLCSPSFLPPQFDQIVRLGRHRRISLLWTAQRMAEVARRLTAATDVFVLFAHTEPRDLEAIADRCGSEVADKVAGLGLHGLLCWDVLGRRELPAGELAGLGCLSFASAEARP